MNYTKGEWKVAIARYKDVLPSIHVYREEAKEPIVGSGTGRIICDVSNTDNPDAEANAQLISSAPDLYEGLKDALKEICRMCVRLNPQHENCESCEEMERSRLPLVKAVSVRLSNKG